MSLYDATKDLHHACERHALGQALVGGHVTIQQYADWLWAMRVLHLVVDRVVPQHMKRDEAFASDLRSLPQATPSRAALTLAASFAGRPDCTGAAYVLHGAHRSGGRVLAPKLVKRGMPCAHIMYPLPAGAQGWVQEARTREDMTQQARATFYCLLAVMSEITERPEAL